MGELEFPYAGKPSSARVFFSDEKVVVATGKSVGGFAGLASIDCFEVLASPLVLAAAVRAAWNAKAKVKEYDDELLRSSWAPIREAFSVTDYSMARHVVLNRGKDAIGVIPTEWKGDNREYLRAKAMRLDIDVSDEELGAAVRRAMELTTS